MLYAVWQMERILHDRKRLRELMWRVCGKDYVERSTWSLVQVLSRFFGTCLTEHDVKKLRSDLNRKKISGVRHSNLKDCDDMPR